LAERYQIIGLLGKGGMGEVYRADDLTLGIPVALKFLSSSFAKDPDRLGRFYNEVRIAREISHPSVCRVHDIGDVDGQPFLSMEYVDGEDLSSLLRRIGRLPTDKAVEIARQICAGLAAAHDKGVLHRDLKPANIMLDGRGRARITDFGLAGLSQDIVGAEVRSGTPAYMSPEQLAGKEVSVRSDIYALGVVLYELFTGKRVFDGKSLAEITRMHLDEEPTRPTAVVPELDPAIERVILRCLEKSSDARPPSALSVAAALPGGDPLAAALEAGETPSPEMVAAAGGEGEIRPSLATAALSFVIVGVVLVLAMTMGSQIHHLVPMEKTPEALEDRSREILEELGANASPADTALGLFADIDYIQHVAATYPSTDRWSRLEKRPPAVKFWFRQSPRLLMSSSTSARVSPINPPLRISGMAGVYLDMQGRLAEFYVVTPQVEDDSGSLPVPPPDWSLLLERAELDEAQLTETEPQWTPFFFVDERVAWEGVYPDAPEVPIRVEAAAYRGRPVYFRVLQEWTRPERVEFFQLSPGQRAGNLIAGVLIVTTLLAALLLARRNLRLGRGDRKGALRLAVYTFSIMAVGWVLQADHVNDFFGEFVLVLRSAGNGLLMSAILWAFYIALEPYVRRRWPGALISWNRFLGGGFRDPLVGQHILIGCVAGVAVVLVVLLGVHITAWMGRPPGTPDVFRLDYVLSMARAVSAVLEQNVESLALALGFLLMLLLFRILLRKEVLAGLALALIFGAQMTLNSELSVYIALPLFTLAWVLPAFVAIRFGLLALASCIFSLSLLLNFPLTWDFGHWMGSSAAFVLLVVVGIAFYGFQTAVGSRSLLKDDTLHG
jgi:serine/threonine-protein kinase